MDDGIKQRIIGAIVLLALAVIFVPIFFERERIEPLDRKTLIPTMPDIEPVVMATPEIQAENIEPAEPVEEIFQPDETMPIIEKPFFNNSGTISAKQEDKVLNRKGVPQSWVLQIASYQSREWAEKMQKDLTEIGYEAYIREAYSDSGKLLRVYVGPKLNISELRKEKAAIEKKFNIETLLLKFEP